MQQVPGLLDIGVHLLDQRLQSRRTSPGRAAGRRSRWRSRRRTARGRRGPARTPRPGARPRRRSGWCPPRSPPASADDRRPAGSPSRRRPRRPAPPYPGSTATFAVGKPSSRPRWSPADHHAGEPERLVAQLPDPAEVPLGHGVPDQGRRARLGAVGDQRQRVDHEVAARPARPAWRRSPAARKPNRKFSPTTIRAGCSGRSTASTNCAGLQLATSGVNSTTTTSSTPAAVSSSIRRSSEVSSGGAWSGRMTDIGCGQNVTATSGAPGSAACAVPHQLGVAAVDAVEVADHDHRIPGDRPLEDRSRRSVNHAPAPLASRLADVAFCHALALDQLALRRLRASRSLPRPPGVSGRLLDPLRPADSRRGSAGSTARPGRRTLSRARR